MIILEWHPFSADVLSDFRKFWKKWTEKFYGAYISNINLFEIKSIWGSKGISCLCYFFSSFYIFTIFFFLKRLWRNLLDITHPFLLSEFFINKHSSACSLSLLFVKIISPGPLTSSHLIFELIFQSKVTVGYDFSITWRTWLCGVKVDSLTNLKGKQYVECFREFKKWDKNISTGRNLELILFNYFILQISQLRSKEKKIISWTLRS